MIIVIDGQQLDEATVPGDNLEEVLEQIMKFQVPDSRTIVGVRVNEADYREDVPHAALEVPRADIGHLEITTVTGEDVARHFIQNGSFIINSLTEALPRITEMFRLGDEAEANEHYLRFLESFHLLMAMCHNAGQVLGARLGVALPGGRSLSQIMTRFAEIMNQLVEIQEQSDWIYLADLLEYELTPELEALSAALPGIRESTIQG
ncbi:MAG: hypothetical protein V1816_28540 [Pseudomonadota bacterium]